jgi:hypothetical protein
MADFPKLASDDVVMIVFFVLAFLAGMIVWLSLLWYRHRRIEIEAALKQDMLSRGMSATEIERVMSARLGANESAEVSAKRFTGQSA